MKEHQRINNDNEKHDNVYDVNHININKIR